MSQKERNFKNFEWKFSQSFFYGHVQTFFDNPAKRFLPEGVKNSLGRPTAIKKHDFFRKKNIYSQMVPMDK